MIKTIEIAPYMYVDHLLDLIENQFWETIVPSAWDDSGLGIDMKRDKLREILLKDLLAGQC